VPPARLMDELPGIAVTVPPQSLVISFADAITNPSGKLSVNAIPVRVRFGCGSLFGLLIVKLNNVVPFAGTVSGRKSLLIVGGRNGFTVTVVATEGALLQPRVVTMTV
jgi:hypothetical protein